MSDQPAWVPVDGVTEPDEARFMTNLDLVPDLTHPLRGTIVRRLRQPRTVAQLAEALDVPITRLYHHVNRLEELDMIRVVATRRVGAVTERRYQVTALSWKLDDEAFETLDPRELAQGLGSLFDVAKISLQRWIESSAFEEHRQAAEERFTLSFSEFRLTREQQRELVSRLTEIAEGYRLDDEEAEEDDPELMKTTFFVATFPEV